MTASSAFVHFTVGPDRLAVALDEIREVARVSGVTVVPRAPAAIRGLANIRGKIVTLLDLDVVYGRPGAAPPADGPGHAMVLTPPHDHLALFTRSRVDIGRGREAVVAARGPDGRATDSGAPDAPARSASGDAARAPLGGLVAFDGMVIHLLPAAEVAAHCEARVLERYRQQR